MEYTIESPYADIHKETKYMGLNVIMVLFGEFEVAQFVMISGTCVCVCVDMPVRVGEIQPMAMRRPHQSVAS